MLFLSTAQSASVDGASILTTLKRGYTRPLMPKPRIKRRGLPSQVATGNPAGTQIDDMSDRLERKNYGLVVSPSESTNPILYVLYCMIL
jgi:hypothetical protein